ALTPKSTPTAPWFSALGRCDKSTVSTAILTNHRWATREMVADWILPVKRNGSRIRTHPSFGMRMREPSTRNWSLVIVKRSRMPFLRITGYLAPPEKKLLKDSTSWIVAICGRIASPFLLPNQYDYLM